MKPLKLIALAAFALFFSQCKTTAPTAPSGPAPSVLEVVNILDSAQSIFLHAASVSQGDPYDAIEQTSAYLSLMPNVKDVYTTDSTYIHITLNSGLETTFSFDQKDSAGNSIFRGGSSKEKANPILSNLKSSEPLSKHTITNKKVLFFAADTKSLPAVEPQLQKSTTSITNSGLGLEVTVLRDEQCTYEVVETFKDYGLVIIDTHGEENAFRIGPKITFSGTIQLTEDVLKNLIKTQIDNGAYDKIIAGDLSLGRSFSAILYDEQWYKKQTNDRTFSVDLTSKYLNHLPDMPNTVLFGNMCYSGWIATEVHKPRKYYFDRETGKIIDVINEKTIKVDAIAQAFLNRNPISYYGYTRDIPPGTSRSVQDEFASYMENSLIKRLITKKDSTGNANLSDVNNIEFFDVETLPYLVGDLYFRHYGADDYSYQNCGDSITDSRDGQKYATVCIGNQTWMAENLRYNAPGSSYYNNDPVYLNWFGRLYDAPTVINKVCPKGWHVPSSSEWQQLFDQFGGIDKAGGALKDASGTGGWDPPNLGATNISGFKALAGGYKTATGPFAFYGIEAVFCSTALDANGNPLMTILDRNSVQAFVQGNSAAAQVSCRCLKD